MDYRTKVAPEFRWLIAHEDGWQFGERGVLARVVSALHDQPKTCVEFGAGDGLRLPVLTGPLIDAGWKARLIEEDAGAAKALANRYPSAEVVAQRVTPETIDVVDKAFAEPPTLVVIDVDANDLDLALAIKTKPAAFLIEHWDEGDDNNPRAAARPVRVGERTDREFTKQANSVAVAESMAAAGYVPVWVGRINGLYVRSDLAGRLERKRTPAGKDPIRLNIGSYDIKIDGFTNIDRNNGTEAYPLDYDDASVDEIRASHILEHFSHTQTQDVLNEWVRVLKPGGRIRIAVPDFGKLVEVYDGKRVSEFGVQTVTFGGQTDANDYHKSMFDYGGLFVMMQRAGLVGIDRWKADVPNECASLSVSLNLEGYKPSLNLQEMSRKTRAVMSVPRILFTDTARCCEEVFRRHQIPWDMETGAFWGQCLERAMDRIANRNDGTEFILAVDYDTIFDSNVLGRLFMLMDANPDVDAIAPLQVGRGRDFMLVASDKAAGPMELIGPLFDATMAHFGCTLIRVSALKKMAHPWFWAQPNAENKWGEGRTDDDIYFWKKFREVGNRLCVATRVSVGHIQSVISWPTENMRVHHQYMDNYNNYGPPDERRQ